MKLSGMYCPRCAEFIYSRANHDFHWCKCESVAIDGGQEYSRVCSKLEPGLGTIGVTVDMDSITNEKLYRDWNRSMDLLGALDLFAMSKYKTEIIRRKGSKVAGETAKSKIYLWLTRNLPHEPLNPALDGVALRVGLRLSMQEIAYVRLVWATQGRTKMIGTEVWETMAKLVADSVIKSLGDERSEQR